MPSEPAFAIAAPPLIPIDGAAAGYPVGRIFCVGRNYAAHAAEMGAEVDREAPFYFTKSARAVCLSGARIPYPPGSRDVQYEMECVVALGAPASCISVGAAPGVIFGYACGIDLTRRDLQADAKDKRRPWDLGKDFENAAILGPISRADDVGPLGERAIRLTRDGILVQEARLSDMIWSVPEVIAHLSRFYHLGPGDLIFTGTPAGVGPVQPGSVLRGEIEGLAPLHVTIVEPE